LRVNGSRECPADARLREAIQKAAKKDWIASSQGLLAMTGLGACAKQKPAAQYRGRVFKQNKSL
jgi:hypothetical protein